MFDILDRYRLAGKLTDFLTAFLGVWAIQLTFGITVRNPLTVVLFLCIYVLSMYSERFNYTGPHKVIIEGIPWLFGMILSSVLTRSLYPMASSDFTSSLFKGMTLLILFGGFLMLAALILRTGWKAIGARISDAFQYSPEKISLSGIEQSWDSIESERWKREMPDGKGMRLIGLVTGCICFVCYLPYFLYEYPGIMTADSIVQYQQIIGVLPLSNHHPVVHTLLIKVFYNLGMFFTNDPIRAVSFYTLFQMIFMCICAGALVKEVMRTLGSFDIRIVAALMAFLALFPVNAVFAVTIWKDVPFAGITVLLLCHISSMCRKNESEIKVSDFVLFAVLGVLFSLFRSNAWYAFVVFVLFFVYHFRKKIRLALPAALLTVIAVITVKGPVFAGMGVTGPDFTESLSLPLQQVARVLVEEGEVSESDLALIDRVIDRTYIRELYVGHYADNIKELVRAGHPEILEADKGEYLGLWIRLGLQNPGKYIRAWYDLEGGYIYSDVAYKVADADGIMPNDLGLYPMPIIGGRFIKVKEILIKLSDFMPLYGMLFSIGAYAWGLVIALIAALKRGNNLLCHMPMIMLVLTLLIAAPVVDYRYGYAYVLGFPLILAISFSKKGVTVNDRQQDR